jgi:predicted nucleic acid-binding protein
MAIYLLDTSVIVAALNAKRNRRGLLHELLRNGNVLACCTINMIEVYSGMRPVEKQITDDFLGGMAYYEVTWPIARRAGTLRYNWTRKGHALSLADATIAAVVIHGLTLITDNQKHFPMPEVPRYTLPS